MADQTQSRWTFLTNHAHVLICLVRDPDARLRDVAVQVGITERAAQGIVSDLVEAGYVERSRIGRRNSYVINADLPLRHELEREHSIGSILKVIAPAGQRESRAGAGS